MAETAADKPKKMSLEDIQAALAPELTDAVDFIDEDIAPQRERATRYYQGQPFGDEVQGRSQAVSRDVHDAVNGILPSLVDVFLGNSDIVSYLPRQVSDIPFAEQASDYIPYCMRNDNAAFTELYNAMKDALVRKAGFLKWWWDEKTCLQRVRYTGQTQAQIDMLVQGTEGVEVAEISPAEAPYEAVNPETGEPEQAFDVVLETRYKEGRMRFAAVPPEEVLIGRKARNTLASSRLVGHRCYVPVSDLVEMGYDFEEMLQYAGTGDTFDFNEEREARVPGVDVEKADDTPDPSMRQVLYIESYIRMDIDGDGIAELCRICTVGNAYHVIKHEPVQEIQMACLSPDPEPHTFFGSCTADVTMDIQRQKSQLLRGMFDSLAQSINPRMGVVEGQVRIEDVLNNEIGALIRMRAPGMVQAIDTPFVGAQVLPVMEMLDGVKEARTGQTRASAGLDPDALQSTTKAAVSATVQAAQQRIKLIARIFAETGMRDLFKGLLRMAVQHQDQPRMVRLRGQYVQVDPRGWDAEMDVTIDTALGTGNLEEKMAVMTAIVAKQEQILQTLGPNNPLVTPLQYYNALSKMVKMSGVGVAEEFFSNPALAPSPEQPQPAEGEQANPADALAQAEVQKAQIQQQTDMQKAQMQQQTDMQKAQMQQQMDKYRADMEDARARDQMQLQLFVEKMKVEAQYKMQVDTAAIDADVADANNERQARVAMAQAQQAPEQPE